jgi:hypothetical protein
MCLAETEAHTPYIKTLEQSHMALKTLACLYLEIMVDVNGIHPVIAPLSLYLLTALTLLLLDTITLY